MGFRTSYVCLAMIVTSIAMADTQVFTGKFAVKPGDTQQFVNIPQFNDNNGSLKLQSVEFDFLTAVVGEFMRDGSGIPVLLSADLQINYLLQGQSLTTTGAAFSLITPNLIPGPGQFFNVGIQKLNLNDPTTFDPFIGTDTFQIQALLNLTFSQNPPDKLPYDVAGDANWAITYHFVPEPASLSLLAVGFLCLTKRRIIQR